MKTILTAAVALTLLVAGAADARPHHHPHKVCTFHHHHQVCRWVR